MTHQTPETHPSTKLAIRRHFAVGMVGEGERKLSE